MQILNRLHSRRNRPFVSVFVTQICSSYLEWRETAETRWTQRFSRVPKKRRMRSALMNSPARRRRSQVAARAGLCVYRVSAVLICLFGSFVLAQAENAVVLESFEENVASAFPVSTPGSRP